MLFGNRKHSPEVPPRGEKCARCRRALAGVDAGRWTSATGAYTWGCVGRSLADCSRRCRLRRELRLLQGGPQAEQQELPL